MGGGAEPQQLYPYTYRYIHTHVCTRSHIPTYPPTHPHTNQLPARARKTSWTGLGLEQKVLSTGPGGHQVWSKGRVDGNKFVCDRLYGSHTSATPERTRTRTLLFFSSLRFCSGVSVVTRHNSIGRDLERTREVYARARVCECVRVRR